MEEAIVDVALDLNLLPPEPPQTEAQAKTRTDHRDQAQLLATVPQVEQAPSPDHDEEQARLWPQNRAARVEALRRRVANGTYQVDSAALARSILRNSTRFVENC